MRRGHRSVGFLVCLALLLGAGSVWGQPPSPLTQREWMVSLVETLGLSFGLPDHPKDSDYLRLLQGDRFVRVEAEEARDPQDVVSQREILTFGPYSGKGWLSGVSAPTTVRLRFLLPHGGTYRLQAVLRRPGHLLRIGNRTLSADGGERLARVDVGEITLPAGPQEVSVTLPPDGGVDVLEFSAPSLPPLIPVGGWNLDRPLTRDVMAETVAPLLGLETLLPLSKEVLQIEAENVLAGGAVDITKAGHYGEPSGGRWVRAGGESTEVELVFTPPAAGIYDLAVRGAAQGAASARVNGGPPLPLSLAPYLQISSLGTFYVAPGKNRLHIKLPPAGGIDMIRLQGRNSAAYRRLVGLPSTGEFPDREEVDALLSLLSDFGAGR